MAEKNTSGDLAAYQFIQAHIAQAQQNVSKMAAAAKKAQEEEASRRTSANRTTKS